MRVLLVLRVAQVACLAFALLAAGLVVTGGPSSGAVAYDLGWDRSGVTIGDDGSWSTTTAGGVEIVVLAGTLTTRSLTLVACEHRHGLWGRFLDLVGVEPAAAGHGGTVDPLLVETTVVEDLAALSTTTIGSATTDAGEPAYCAAHTAVAGGSAAERLDGTSAATVSVSALVDGQAVSLSTDLPWGWTADLDDALALDPAAPATVTFVRSATEVAEAVADGDATALLRALAPQVRSDPV